MRVLTHFYPGWHPIPERDESFYPGFTEWDLVEQCRPRFVGHQQPRLPAWGRYDDRDSDAIERRIVLSRQFGIDGWVYGFFWCRGKRVFQESLDQGFLGCASGRTYPFALMWANRMPRRVLPVRRSDVPVIDPARRVTSDVEDFAELIAYLAEHYFTRSNYVRVKGKLYFSIFDSTFFVRELGVDGARQAVVAAGRVLHERGLPPLHLAAVDPQPELYPHLSDIGFDSVTHYVDLPRWKGPRTQHYAQCAQERSQRWGTLTQETGLPYYPSVSPGWDASPRAADFGPERPDRYPWSPVVVGESPAEFQVLVRKAASFVRNSHSLDEQLLFVASFNEWSEGHYLEPDERYGAGWLRALASGLDRSHKLLG